MRVAAGIVLYYPDFERLEENLLSVAPQVEEIFVYINGIDRISAIPQCVDMVIVEKSATNVGLAKALNSLCYEAAYRTYDYILILDQDSVVSEGMVHELLRFQGEKVGIVAPTIIDRNTNVEFFAEDSVRRVDRVITSGSLVSLAAWKAVGGFDERLFVDWVDFEFNAALRLHGYCVLQSANTSLLHEMGRREPAFSVPMIKKHQIRRVTLYRTNHSLVRHRDRGRSWGYMLKKYRGTTVYSSELRCIFKNTIRDIVIERRKIAITAQKVLGYREGKKLYKQQFVSEIERPNKLHN